jgi:tetratricopeptide (TPR) repeat protein
MLTFSRLLFLITILMTALGGLAHAGTTCPSLRPGMPEEVRGLTEIGLSREQYQNLAEQWQEYARQHPQSAVAEIMIYRALYYGGQQDAEKLKAHITKALAIDPQCPEALDAAMRTALRHGEPLGTRAECYEFGLQAVAAAPNWATPHVQLYVLGSLLDRPDEARQHLIALLDKGYFSPALLDYGYNMLIGAEPGGVIFTNGDNDTFPCLALQAAHDIRPDITVANLSLMTLKPLAKQIFTLGTKGHAAVLQMKELDSVEQAFLKDRAPYGYSLGKALLEHLCQKAASGKMDRPLYLAVTLFPDATTLCGSPLILEGLLQRVAPMESGVSTEPVTDIEKTYRLFSSEYRLDSATDFTTDWSRIPAHVHLISNYTNILFRLAYDAAGKNEKQIMEFGFEESARIASFHENQSLLEMILEYWGELDPGSEKLKQWQWENR